MRYIMSLHNRSENMPEVALICPSCGTHIPDGSAVCPACHARLSGRGVPASDAPIYCERCGVLVSKDDECCPSCGMPLPKAKEPPRPTGRGKAISERLADPSATGPQRRLEASEEDDSSLSDTHAMPRIESAIPPDPHS